MWYTTGFRTYYFSVRFSLMACFVYNWHFCRFRRLGTPRFSRPSPINQNLVTRRHFYQLGLVFFKPCVVCDITLFGRRYSRLNSLTAKEPVTRNGWLPPGLDGSKSGMKSVWLRCNNGEPLTRQTCICARISW